MAEIALLTEAELRSLVPLDHAAVDCVEAAFAALATKPVVMPPILRLDITDAKGEVDVKTAYVPGLDSFAIKVSPGFFDNPKLGLPSVNGLMLLLSARTGLVEAALFDNGYLTDVRTAAAGAVAARHLSRPDARIATIFGAGAQARLQLEALRLVRPIEAARIWARDRIKGEHASRELSAQLGMTVSFVADPAEAVRGTDILVTATPAQTPILKADWLEPGQHLTAMGSDAEHKNEVDPSAFERADIYVPDRLAQTRVLGELHHAIANGIVPDDRPYPELGEIVVGMSTGRNDARQITFADLTGTGVQDTAIAAFAYARAKAARMGRTFSS